MADTIEIANTVTNEKPVSIKDAISQAVETHTKEETVSEEEVKEETKETFKTSDTLDEDKLEADEAIKLFRALKNPDTRGSVINFLVEKSGIVINRNQPIETKQEVKEATKDLTSMLKESLGEQFEFLADKFAPAIEKYLNEKRQEDLRDIRENLENQEREKLEAQSSKAIVKMTEDFFGPGNELPNEVQSEMSKFMDKVPPSADLSVKEYIEIAFNAAVGKLGISKPASKQKQEKVERNRSDSASRLESDRGSRTAIAKPDTSKSMNLKESIQAAIDSVNKDLK